MFSGIVEEIGRIREMIAAPDGTRLSIGARTVLEDLAVGESVAVDGACLTVTRLDRDGFWVGLSPETQRRTNLGELRPGDEVNLERAVKVGARFGGHYVQGHVDGVGEIVRLEPEGDSLRMTFRAPTRLMPYIVVKGYISVDGVSLTVTDRTGDQFGVALVAYTRSVVTLARKPVGSRVNLEVDVIAKYVESLLEARVEHGQ